MLYHVVRRPPHHSATTSSNQSKLSPRGGSVPPPTLMPRYHYSRIVPNNPTESIPQHNQYDGQTIKSPMTTTTSTPTTNNNYSSFKSTVIPLVTNQRTITPNKREFIQIPVTREDGTSIITNHQNRLIPINFINETNVLPPTVNNSSNGNTSPRPLFTNLLRPTSRYFQHHYNTNSNEEPMLTSAITTASNLPRLPAVSRRLSLTIPVTTNVSTNVDDDINKQSNPSSPTRQIPIRLPQPTTISTTTHVSTPAPSNSRISSAILRTSPVSNALRRQQTEIGSNSLSSPTLPTQTPIDLSTSSPIRRAEVMAREAIQGITRLQQQRNNSQNDINHSPPSARRVIINLKNNQSISLDSRLSSAKKPPPIPSSARLLQRNNLYHIPVLHEIQLPPRPSSTILSENSSLLSTLTSVQNGNFKNEFHMEIPVINHDQENHLEQTNDEHIRRRILSANQNSHQTLKSILKRSSSRETVSRKNVSFMNV